MGLFYDARDDQIHEKRGSQILYWLDDLGAKPLTEARPDEPGFVFAGNRGIEDYRRLLGQYACMRDLPAEREPLLRLDSVLDILSAACVRIPAPRTWVLPLDLPIPSDISYPVFVRTAETSLKLGGRICRVRNEKELVTEAAELRRALRWDAVILAREWLDLAPAGDSSYGPVPQEVRVWIADGEPFAWSFHHLHIVPNPTGYPPAAKDLATVREHAKLVGAVFSSRLVVADFAVSASGKWWFIEAGPGGCAGTAHERVFKAVSLRLIGRATSFSSDHVGGLF